MLAQGWSPGSPLGLSAPEIKSSKTRVSFRNNSHGMSVLHGENDNEGQSVGLDIFQGILGRLNGKTDTQLESGQRSSRDIKMISPAEKRWEFSYFTSGGFLSGENSEESRPKTDPGVQQAFEIQSQPAENNALQASQTCVNINDPSDEENITCTGSRRKRLKATAPDKQVMIGGEVPVSISNAESSTNTIPLTVAGSPTPAVRCISVADANGEQQRSNRSNRKLKEKKNKLADKLPSPILSQGCSAPQTASDQKDGAVTEMPLTSGQFIPNIAKPMTGRHMVRQRFIRSKRMATMNTQALNEVRKTLWGPWQVPLRNTNAMNRY